MSRTKLRRGADAPRVRPETQQGSDTFREPHSGDLDMSKLSFAVCLALAGSATLASLVVGSDAYAGGRGKDFYSQTYQFDRPMNGYEGFSGAYHCSYVKVPKKVCTASGTCKTVWELTQTCQ
jgi:hypothetical protein